jgi:amidase
VRRGDVTAAELAAQAAAGVAKVNPLLSAVVELFDDAVADPLPAAPRRRLLRRRALPDEGPGPDPEGAAAGDGLAVHARQPAHRRQLPHRPHAPGRPEPDRPHHHAGVRRLQFGREPGRLHHAQPLGPDYTTLGSSAGTAAMVAAGVLPLSHATDGGGSIRIPAGANGNIGLKPSRGVFSIAPKLSDLTGLVSTQGCQSRTVRDTAAFVDHCRGGAPGEFMPYWTPAEPYTAS